MTRRPAYTLLELMVALGSASVLMVGLSSALFIAAQGLNLDQGASALRGRADAAMGRLLADARPATRYRSVTPTAIEFDVPDRTGDGASDRLRYEWNGVVGGPLTRTLNGGSPVTLLRDVRALTFGSTTRAVTPQNVMTTPLTVSPIVWSQTTPSIANDATSIALALPPKVVPGDILIAMLATTGEQESVTAPGWTELCYATNGNNSKLRLSVWQRIATASEPSTLNWYWEDTADVIAGIISVSNHDPTIPVGVTGMAINENQKSRNPVCQSATVARPYSLVLRLGAFGKDSITAEDVTGLSGHTDLWARAVNDLSAGWGYATTAETASTGTATFALRSSSDYATITIVITPRTAVGP